MKRILTIWLTLLLAGGIAWADFELLLEDGRVLSGVDVRRQKGEYALKMADGQTISIPEELVAEVRITAGYAQEFGMVNDAQPLQVAGDEIDLDDENRPFSGLTKGQPEQLEGDPVRPPRTAEQTKALGPPAEFKRDIIDPNWRPESVFNASNDVTNFNPSTWSESIVDNSWVPESDYTQKSDVSNFAPSTWSDGVVDNSWKPSDGFSKRGTSFRRDVSEAGRLSSRPVLAYDTTRRPAGQILPASATTVRRLGSARLSLVSSISAVSTPPSTAAALQGSQGSPATVATTSASAAGLPVAVCTWCARFNLASVSGSRRRPTQQGPPTADRIRDCARNLLRVGGPASKSDHDGELDVRWIIDEAFAGLPLDLYKVLLGGEGKEVRAVFTYGPEQCRLITGDLASLFDNEKMTEEEKLRFGIDAYNKALAVLPEQPPVSFVNSPDKIDYALAVSMLVTPGATAVSLLTRFEDLDAGGESCERSARSRRRGARKIDQKFEPPRVEFVNGSDVVTFYSWDRRGGEVRNHRVRLLASGTVDLQSRLIVSHQGNHQCE